MFGLPNVRCDDPATHAWHSDGATFCPGGFPPDYYGPAIIPGGGLSHHPKAGAPIKGHPADPRNPEQPSDRDADHAAGANYPRA